MYNYIHFLVFICINASFLKYINTCAYVCACIHACVSVHMSSKSDFHKCGHHFKMYSADWFSDNLHLVKGVMALNQSVFQHSILIHIIFLF